MFCGLMAEMKISRPVSPSFSGPKSPSKSRHRSWHRTWHWHENGMNIMKLSWNYHESYIDSRTKWTNWYITRSEISPTAFKDSLVPQSRAHCTMPGKYIVPPATLKRHYRKKLTSFGSQREPSHDKLRRALGWRLPGWTPGTNVQRRSFKLPPAPHVKRKWSSMAYFTLDLLSISFNSVSYFWFILLWMFITDTYRNHFFSAVYAFCPNLFLDVAAGRIPLRLSGETASHLQFAEDTWLKLKQLHRSSTCYIHAKSYLLNIFELYF